MAANLRQLMIDANALAEQIQHERQKPMGQPQARTELHILEERLRSTWNAIRMARLSGETALETLPRSTKWDRTR